MKRLGYALSASLYAATILALVVNAGGRFDQKLTIDKQVIHVLNRLTFGPRPGDVEQVRRLGIEKWIDLQLHPDRLPENPALESKLKPLETVQLQTWQIQEKYSSSPQFPPASRFFSPLSLVSQQQFSALMNCSVDERQKVLAS